VFYPPHCRTLSQREWFEPMDVLSQTWWKFEVV